jgi:hypothetical protein
VHKLINIRVILMLIFDQPIYPPNNINRTGCTRASAIVEHFEEGIWKLISSEEIYPFTGVKTFEEIIDDVYHEFKGNNNYRLTIVSGTLGISKDHNEWSGARDTIAELKLLKQRLADTKFNFIKEGDEFSNTFRCLNTGIKIYNYLDEDTGEFVFDSCYGLNKTIHFDEANLNSEYGEAYLRSIIEAKISEVMLICENMISYPVYPSLGVWEQGLETNEVYYFSISVKDFAFKHWKLFDFNDELSFLQQLNEHPSNKYNFLSGSYSDYRDCRTKWRDHHQEIFVNDHFLYIENGDSKKAGLPLHAVFGEYGETSRMDHIFFRHRIWNPYRTPFSFFYSDFVENDIVLKNRIIEVNELAPIIVEVMNQRVVTDLEYFKLLKVIWGSEEEVLKILDLKNETLEGLKDKFTIISNCLWDII